MPTADAIKACRESLQRIQDFDAESISRTEELGLTLSFKEAVADADRLIAFYQRIPLSITDDLSTNPLEALKRQADSDYNILDRIYKFSPSQGNPAGDRSNLINQLRAAYEATFTALWQYLAYGVARTTDTKVIEREARATIQEIKDQSASIADELKKTRDGAESILANIKSMAAEVGVTQQAQYFKDEADKNETAAATWEKRVTTQAVLVAVFAVISIFLHKIPWIAPATSIESAQLISSKLLIFAVLSYMLLLGARNFLSHKHNAVVNRHRQNALLTYKALADAAQAKGAEDIVLAHAASCIFAPQETGYSRGGAESGGGSKSVLELLTKATAKTDGSH
ncbi:MAG: hypothetical protein M1550_04985 [Deltaproteobacteria bacterium]|nr:hypothetical protein [Deltaproteobacteria bacterium]